MNTDTSCHDALLRTYAERYENSDFLTGDPSWFMHQVSGSLNQESMAFIASALSYGSRTQFMAKIQLLLDASCGRVDEWVRTGRFTQLFTESDERCFYRLYNNDTMHRFLTTYSHMLNAHGSLGDYLRGTGVSCCLNAVRAICAYFSDPQNGPSSAVVPRTADSACKRVCMFMRWMVRSGSPVDLGLWADFIDRRTLIMPLDTHVVTQSVRLGLLSSRTASMSAAIKLTQRLAEIFPDDPLKGDFALFGYGVNNKKS